MFGKRNVVLTVCFQENDCNPCFCCRRSNEDEEDEELKNLTSLAEMEKSEAKLLAHKQYYDSNAGDTLQDQVTAAYNRWIAAEKQYNEALDRIKRDCKELGLDWHGVKAQTEGEVNDSDLRYSMSTLVALRSFSEHAKVDLDRIQAELDLLLVPVSTSMIEKRATLLRRLNPFSRRSETKKSQAGWTNVPESQLETSQSEVGTNGQQTAPAAASDVPVDSASDVSVDPPVLESGESLDRSSIPFGTTLTSPGGGVSSEIVDVEDKGEVGLAAVIPQYGGGEL